MAVQEGANAYLQRQFRTLAIFAAIAFFGLLVLPADDATVRIFRSVFFLVGAGFSAAIGYLGMSLAVRANLRVAAAANETLPPKLAMASSMIRCSCCHIGSTAGRRPLGGVGSSGISRLVASASGGYSRGSAAILTVGPSSRPLPCRTVSAARRLANARTSIGLET